VSSSAPSISAGDSAELVTAAVVLGVAHSPGYPLYVLGAKAFHFLVPWGNPAYGVTLFSGFCVALSLALFVRIFSSDLYHWLIFVLAGLSPLMLKSATVSEVFGPNLLAVAVVTVVALPLMVGDQVLRQRRMLPLLFFVLGLGLGNQQTLVLLVPALGAIGWIAFRRLRVQGGFLTRAELWRGGVLIVLFFSLGLSVYFYLLIRSQGNPLLDWENPETWDRFIKVVSRARYGSLQLAQGTPVAASLKVVGQHLVLVSDTIVYQFGIGGSILLLVGLGNSLFARFKGEALYFVLGFTIAGPVFLVWAGVTPSESTRFMLERFLIMPIFLTTYFVWRGASFASSSGRGGKTFLFALCLLLWLPSVVRWSIPWAQQNRWGQLTRYHGINILRHVPPQGILISDRADETEFSLAYLTNVQNGRPDIRFIDANAGVTTSIYGSDYYETWGKPRLARREHVESKIINSTVRPVVYATLDTKQIQIPRQQSGLLYQTLKNEKSFSQKRFPHWLTLLRHHDVIALDARKRKGDIQENEPHPTQPRR